jgi:hypothetical protein
MAKKKVVRKTSTKRTKKAVKRKPVSREKEPEYMVQVYDPKNTRKNILESLREVIIFMQSYEKFKKIQEEKVATFTQLKTSITEINRLVEGQLKSYFPKGKLKALGIKPEPVKKVQVPVEEFVPEMAEEVKQEVPVKKTASELDELEAQLKDIEGQLRTMS